MYVLTSQLPNEDFARRHLSKVAQVSGPSGIGLRREQAGAGVDKDTAVLLVEILDRTGVGIELDSPRHRSSEFLVWEADLGDLRVECPRDQCPEEPCVVSIAIPAPWGR